MAHQIWGVEVPLGSTVSVPSTSSLLHLTGATLVAEAGTVFNAFAGLEILLQVQTAENGSKLTLASLAPARPNAQLNVVTGVKGKMSFSLATSNEQAAKGYRVCVTGFLAPAAGTAPAAGAANAASKQPAQKRKEPEQAAQPAKQQQQQPAAKKQKVAQPEEDEDDEDGEDEEDEEDEDEEAPARTPAKSAQPASAAAKSKPATPSTPTTPAAKQATKPQIVTLKNGLKMQDTKVGTGPEAKDRSQVGIRYRGSLASNGKVFDSNMPRGQPLRFKIGGGDVIAGFEQGTKGMRVGGTRTVVIPAHLGYGARGAPPDIPPNATLVFDLELVSAK